MTEELLISGFGGQGVLSMGKILALAAMREGHEVSWLPAYGPEQRGGTARVTVIISDEPISSPALSTYTSAILLNTQSVDRFADAVKGPDGLLLYEGMGVNGVPRVNEGVEVRKIEAMACAAEIGAPRSLNMVVLGAFLAIRPVVGKETVMKALAEILPSRLHATLPLNERALLEGMNLIKS
jgi:2-oxoglutarate ferredoxin oxidoreductase subunit gamma